MLHLKSKHKEFHHMEFAILIEPQVPIHSDEELYTAIEKHGKAVIQKIEPSDPSSPPETLSPKDFFHTWKGD